MIAATSMYLHQLRNTWRRFLYVTMGVAVSNSLVMSAILGWRDVPRWFGYQVLICACVGFCFWLTGPVLRQCTESLRPGFRWTVRIVLWATILNVGILVGLAGLIALGVFPWSLYGSMFWKGFVPSTVIGTICTVGFTLYETLKYKSQYETAQAKLSSLESRLRPHFLFNTLNSVLALIPEDPAAAERMIVRLSSLLRYSLDATQQSTVRLEQELKMATDYLEIEKTRFGPRLQYSLDVPADLMDVAVPPFSLQTLVENSVKYGGSEIQVSARNGNGRVVLSVWDSGSGFSGADKFDKILVGHGLDNLRGRLAALWGAAASLEFPRDGEGTMVRLSIPSRAHE